MVRLVPLFLTALLLTAQTSAPDTKQRIKAVRELAKQGSGSIPKIVAYISDPQIDVRVEAVKALTDIGTVNSLDPLIKATQDNDPEVQIRATDGLVNFYYPGYVKTGFSASLRRAGTAIKGKFTDTNDQVIDPYVDVRPEVIRALGQLARGGSSVESRANAARAVGVLRGRAAIPDLVAALHSKDSQVIYEALIALEKIRDVSAGPEFQFLLHDLDERVQTTALEATGILLNRAAVPDVRDALQRARSAKVRRQALATLAMMPDEANRPLLAQYFNNKDEGLRTAAAEGYARLKNPADVPQLESAFNAEDKMAPRLALAFALVDCGKIEISEFSPLRYLLDTLNSKNYQGVAVVYLTELARDPRILRSLYLPARTGTRDEKIELAQVFAVSGDRDTVAHLQAMSSDADTDVAQAGLRALRTLKARYP